MTTLAAIVFWLSAGPLVYTHVGYPLVLRACSAPARRATDRPDADDRRPRASRPRSP